MIHLAFEGVDGSGKSTTLAEVHRRLVGAGVAATKVGKRDEPGMTAMTELIVSRTITLDPYTEAYLRLAREHQRLSSAAQATVVLMDRALPSLASMIEMNGLDMARFGDAVAACRARMGRLLTVLCAPPFAVARQRLEQRVDQGGRPLSKKEARGYEYNQRVGLLIDKWAGHPDTGGELLRLDTSTLSQDECASAVLSFLRRQTGIDTQETGERREYSGSGAVRQSP